MIDLGSKEPEEDLQECAIILDADQDGLIQFEDIERLYLEQTQTIFEDQKIEIEEFKKLFNFYSKPDSKNKNQQVLNLENARRIIEIDDYQLTTEQFDEFFKEFLQKGKKYITEVEFNKLVFKLDKKLLADLNIDFQDDQGNDDSLIKSYLTIMNIDEDPFQSLSTVIQDITNKKNYKFLQKPENSQKLFQNMRLLVQKIDQQESEKQQKIEKQLKIYQNLKQERDQAIKSLETERQNILLAVQEHEDNYGFKSLYEDAKKDKTQVRNKLKQTEDEKEELTEKVNIQQREITTMQKRLQELEEKTNEQEDELFTYKTLMIEENNNQALQEKYQNIRRNTQRTVSNLDLKKSFSNKNRYSQEMGAIQLHEQVEKRYLKMMQDLVSQNKKELSSDFKVSLDNIQYDYMKSKRDLVSHFQWQIENLESQVQEYQDQNETLQLIIEKNNQEDLINKIKDLENQFFELKEENYNLKVKQEGSKQTHKQLVLSTLQYSQANLQSMLMNQLNDPELGFFNQTARNTLINQYKLAQSIIIDQASQEDKGSDHQYSKKLNKNGQSNVNENEVSSNNNLDTVVVNNKKIQDDTVYRSSEKTVNLDDQAFIQDNDEEEEEKEKESKANQSKTDAIKEEIIRTHQKHLNTSSEEAKKMLMKNQQLALSKTLKVKKLFSQIQTRQGSLVISKPKVSTPSSLRATSIIIKNFDFMGLRSKSNKLYKNVSRLLEKNKEVDINIFSDIAYKVDAKFEKVKRTLLVTNKSMYQLSQDLQIRIQIPLLKIRGIIMVESSAALLIFRVNDIDFMIETLRRVELIIYICNQFDAVNKRRPKIIQNKNYFNFINDAEDHSEEVDFTVQGRMSNAQPIREQISNLIYNNFINANMSGYLEKRSDWFKEWRDRFFVLSNVGMMYFTDPNKSQPKQFFSTSNFTIDIIAESQYNKKHVFMITGPNYEIVLSAKCEEDFQKWQRAFKKMKVELEEKRESMMKHNRKNLEEVIEYKK